MEHSQAEAAHTASLMSADAGPDDPRDACSAPRIGELLLGIATGLVDFAGPEWSEARLQHARAAIEEAENRVAAGVEVDALASEFSVRLRDLGSTLTQLYLAGALDRADDGRHRIDEVAAQYMEDLGHPNATTEWRSDSTSRWAIFLSNGNVEELLFPWLRPTIEWKASIEYWLVVATWVGDGGVRSRLAEIRSRGVPALAVGVLDRLLKVLWCGRGSVVFGMNGTILGPDDRVVADLQVEGPVQQAVQRAGDILSLTSTLVAHRLLRHLVAVGHRQWLHRDPVDFRVVTVVGGVQQLAQDIGCSGRKAASQVHRLLQVFQRARFRLPKGEFEPLLAWTVRAPSPGRPSLLEITLSDALLPLYATGLPSNGLSQRMDKSLVPIPARLPPMYGHVCHHAGLAHLQVLVLRYMRQCAGRLVLEGSVHMPESLWRDFLRKAGVPDRLRQEIVAEWTAPGPEGFLRRFDNDRFALGETWLDEQMFLEQSGRAQEEGRLRRERSQVARGRRPRAKGR